MISENQFKYCRLDLLQGLTIFLNQSKKGIHKKGGCTAMICKGDSTEWDGDSLNKFLAKIMEYKFIEEILGYKNCLKDQSNEFQNCWLNT
jgi:hypothetical protein